MIIITIMGRLSYVLFVDFLFVCMRYQNSPEFHQNFARISNWSTLNKGITTTQPSHAAA